MTLQNFPFRPEELLPVDRFITYCKDRGLIVNKDLLEDLHKKELLYPCIRVHPGISEFIKVKQPGKKEVFIHPGHLSAFPDAKKIDKKKYYSYVGLSYGDINWMDSYQKDKMVDLPINDKNFKEWQIYYLKEAGFVTVRGAFKDYRILMYSKKQIHIVKHILEWRSLKVTFNMSTNDKILNALKKRIPKHLDSFDKNFKKDWYPDSIQFFKVLNKIQDLHKTFYEEALSKTKDEIKEYSEKEKNKEWPKAYIESVNYLIQEKCFYLKVGHILKKESASLGWLNNWREKILRQGISSHEDINIFNLANSKIALSKFQKKGRLQFMLDCSSISQIIEWLFGVLEYKNFCSLNKLLLGSDEFGLCSICGKNFIPARKTQVTCSAETCKKEQKNYTKKIARRDGKYKK